MSNKFYFNSRIFISRARYRHRMRKELRTTEKETKEKSNSNSISSRRLSIETFAIFVTFVIKKLFKYIILKKKFVLNQIFKKNVVNSRSIFVLFETLIDSVELNSFESYLDLVQTC